MLGLGPGAGVQGSIFLVFVFIWLFPLSSRIGLDCGHSCVWKRWNYGDSFLPSPIRNPGFSWLNLFSSLPVVFSFTPLTLYTLGWPFRGFIFFLFYSTHSLRSDLLPDDGALRWVCSLHFTFFFLFCSSVSCLLLGATFSPANLSLWGSARDFPPRENGSTN